MIAEGRTQENAKLYKYAYSNAYDGQHFMAKYRDRGLPRHTWQGVKNLNEKRDTSGKLVPSAFTIPNRQRLMCFLLEALSAHSPE